REDLTHLSEVRRAHLSSRLGRVKRPPRPVGVERLGNPVLAYHFAHRRHHRTRRLSRPQLRVQQPRGRIVHHLDQSLFLLRYQCQPTVRTSVQVQHLPEARPSRTLHPMPPPSPSLLHQTRRLQQLPHERVRKLHPVLASHRLIEMPRVVSTVDVPVQTHDPLNLRYRSTARRGNPAAHVAQTRRAVRLHAHPPPPPTPR